MLDHCKIEGEEIVRVHMNPRTALFTPSSAQCPVEIAELSVRRRTQVEFVDGRKELIGDDWTVREDAHGALDAKWTGETIFHRETSAEQPSLRTANSSSRKPGIVETVKSNETTG